MLAIGAGGLDVAVAMGGGLFHLKVPTIMGIKLIGALPNFVSAKDIILEILRRIDVKGGVGKILEYFGPGVKTLLVPERATIANMGAETGATTSIFPSDELTKEFLKLQGREDQWIAISEGDDGDYDEIIEINLSDLVPLVAQPHSPGNITNISEIEGLEVDQIAIGSCTNSSLKDMMTVAALLNGKKIHDNVTLGISPGSRQVLDELARNGDLRRMISAGARILEAACGPCIGMGFAPRTDAICVRTFNRNFYGRSGTKTAQVYLTSPETAVATALYGKLTDPRKLGKYPIIHLPEKIHIDDSMILEPANDPSKIEIIRGPNINPLPDFLPLNDDLSLKIILKVQDNITTDHIMPAGAKILPFRSNLSEISKFVFEQVDPTFPTRSLEARNIGGGIIIGGENYGQGSSREHAALAPRFLGIKAIISKSLARIHRDNLINFGIIPFVFTNINDYGMLEDGDILEFKDIRKALSDESDPINVINISKGFTFNVSCDLSKRERAIILTGGKLNYTKELNK